VTFDASSNTLSTSYGLASGNSGITNISNAISPLYHHEVVVTGAGQDGGGNISVMHLNSGVWENVFWGGGLDESQIDYRGFDVAYSQLSGNALVVYGGDGNNPRYRVHNSSANTWGAESTIVLGNDEVAWVELVAKRNSNEIGLLWMDMNKELYGSIWNGENWSDSQSLDTGLHDLVNKCFDAAYEYQDGDLLACWGTTATGIFYSSYSGGSWSATTNYTSTQNQPESLDMAASPSGNGIIVSYDGADNWMRAAYWNGTGFEDGRGVDNGYQRALIGHATPGVAWLNGNEAVVIYDDSDSTATQTIDWETYSISASNWSDRTDATYPGTSFWTGIKAMNMADGRLFVVAVSREHELFFFIYDGTVWLQHIPPDGTPTMVNIRTVPFYLSVKGAFE
jgi:hypothetical protein